MSPTDLEAQAESFRASVRQKMEELNTTIVWNADETAVFFEMLPTKTIDEQGAKTVWINCSGGEKRRVSVLLLASSQGEKKPPLIVFKENCSKVPETRSLNMEQRNGFGAKV